MRSLFMALILSVAAGAAAAQSAADVVRLELLPGWRQADGSRMAGLRIALAPGWKTYWRAPGEAGIPPSFDWSRSDNLVAAQPHFPVPHVFRLNGVRTIGYKDDVVLPIVLRPRDPARPIVLRGRIELGVCESVCMPVEVRIDATLEPAADRGASSIRAALSDAPLAAGEAGVRAVSCRVEPIADGLRLTATMEMPALGEDETTVIEPGDPTIWVSETESRRRGRTLTTTADLVPPEGAPFALDRSTLRFTVLADGRAAEVQGCRSG